MIVIKIILWVLLAVLLIVLLALSIPVQADFIYNSSEMKLVIRYLFLKFPIDIGSDEDDEQEKLESENNTPKTEKNKSAERKDKTEYKKIVSEEKTVTEEKVENTNSSIKTNDDKKSDNTKRNRKKTKRKSKKKKKENKYLKQFKLIFKEKGLDGLIDLLKKIAELAGDFLKPIFTHITIKDLDMNITVAFEDAADTAIRYGYACAGIYPSLAALLNIFKYKKYNVNIAPDFDKKKPEIDLTVKITLVPWFVLFGAVHAFVDYQKLKSNGEL